MPTGLPTVPAPPPPAHGWDSPGKNTGVGCHFLLQCKKVKCESEAAQSCPTPSNPMDYQAPPSMGFFQARLLPRAKKRILIRV